MMKLLGVGWTVWKLTKKRFGAAGGLLAAVLVVAGYLVLTRWLDENHPKLARVAT